MKRVLTQEHCKHQQREKETELKRKAIKSVKFDTSLSDGNITSCSKKMKRTTDRKYNTSMREPKTVSICSKHQTTTR